MKLDENESSYSNLAKSFSLPFPYPSDKKPVERFAIDKNGSFTFMGRKEFKNILEKINELKYDTGFMKLFVYGTVGHVVYLSDCHQLAVDLEDYIKSALFLTYYDSDMNTLDEKDDTGINLERKEEIRYKLDKMTNYHYYIMSSSANNKSKLYLFKKQTNELKIKLFGGFNEKQYSNNLLTMNNQQKEQIQDITSKIPLLLSFLQKSNHENFE
ncbi:9923_t:CDS:2, partial [Funneliformis mosseae]